MPMTGRVTHVTVVRAYDRAMAVVIALLVALLVACAALAMRLHAKNVECRRSEEEAHARARETTMVATVARRLMGGGGVASQLGWISAQVAEALGARSARIEIGPVPAPRAGEQVARLELEGRTGWLYADGGDDPGIVAAPLTGIIDVALERERVAAQEAAAEAARRGNVAKTAVLHLVSHDLRPVVHAIRDAVDQLDAELAERLHFAVDRATRLVDDLVDLSRLESGTLRTDPVELDLREVVRSVASGHPEVQIALPEDLPRVTADRGQIERVLGNLVDNAVRFSPPDTPVRVTGGVGGGKATVRVIDRGPGIPANQRARVFEPFFQGRPSDDGGGLGLTISRGFVEANGGRIVLQSGQNGETAFAVSLPLAAPS
jgi:two-component system sensor histidine kinase KdpD